MLLLVAYMQQVIDQETKQVMQILKFLYEETAILEPNFET